MPEMTKRNLNVSAMAATRTICFQPSAKPSAARPQAKVSDFTVTPENGFGEYQDGLVKKLSRKMFEMDGVSLTANTLM